MAVIKLKGDLDFDLTRLGLKPEMEVNATRDNYNKKGAMNFKLSKGGVLQHCVVWPENYDIIKND